MNWLVMTKACLALLTRANCISTYLVKSFFPNISFVMMKARSLLSSVYYIFLPT